MLDAPDVAEQQVREEQNCVPLLVEAAVEFKKYSRRFMAEYKSKSSQNTNLPCLGLPYTETSTANRTSLMHGYTL